MAEVIVVPGGVQVITAGAQGPQGVQGPPGPEGPEGQQGIPGVGVPTGGTAGQFLAKATNADYDTEWVTGGGGGGAVDSVFGRTGAVVAQTGDYTAAQVTGAVSTAGSYANPPWITSLSALKVTGLGSLAFQNSVSLTTDVTGTLAITNGGTGQTTANAALNAFLPSQAGQSGKVLQTDGSNTSWAAAATGSVTSVSVTTANGVSGSVANPTTTPAITLTLGAITPSTINGVTLSGSSTPSLAVTGTSSVSGSNTGDQTITLTGNVTGSGTGSFATTITAGAVTNAMLVVSIAASKLVGSDIATVGTVTAGTWSATTIAVNKGGTGQTTANAGFNALAPSQTGNSGKYLTTNGTDTSWGAITLSTSTATSLTGYMKGNGSVLSASATVPTSDLSGFNGSGQGFPGGPTFALALSTPATTGSNKTNAVQAPRAGVITKAFAVAKTGPTGADLIFDINLNGATIWSTQANRLKIVAGSTSGTQTSFNVTAVAEGDLLTIDIDQVGSSVAGQDITVYLLILLQNN